MLNWIKNNKNGIIRGMFLVPIILVMIISISHVVSWYDLSNPVSWAIYLSIAIEIAAMSSIAAASVRIKGGVWFVFAIVTLIQFIGNIFFSYKDIDVTSQEFKDWVELTQPVFAALGSDVSDIISQRRWLALLSGGLLPLISLASLHFFIRYGGVDDVKDTVTTPEPEEPKNPPVEPSPVPPQIEETPQVPQVETPKIEEPIVNIDSVEEIPYGEGVRRALEANYRKRAEGTDRWA